MDPTTQTEIFGKLVMLTFATAECSETTTDTLLPCSILTSLAAGDPETALCIPHLAQPTQENAMLILLMQHQSTNSPTMLCLPLELLGQSFCSEIEIIDKRRL